MQLTFHAFQGHVSLFFNEMLFQRNKEAKRGKSRLSCSFYRMGYDILATYKL